MPAQPTKKTITLVLTEDCNLACTYCYLVHKNRGHRMPLDLARAVIDYTLTNRELFPEDVAIWEFMGGEPLLEVDAIEELIGYIRRRAYELNHPWFSRSWFSMSSNGVLYGTPKVQQLIKAYQNQLEIGITIDGTRLVHDIARIFPDGNGSYDNIVANIPLWLKQYPKTSTKITIAHETLPHLAESILHLFELGIRTVNANVVFENVWEPGDDELFERELDRLAEAMLVSDLWRDHTCSLFTRTVGDPLDDSNNGNWCGPGRMLAVDAAGNFYPCNRFMGFALAKRPARMIGNLREGLDLNRQRAFTALTRKSQSPRECIRCDVASGCAWCQGLNYDDADTPTIYQRAIHICAMHKARARANRRFWKRYDALATTPTVDRVRAEGR